jgi:hypothetical protein
VKPNESFLSQPKEFWANVRSISQQMGYTQARTGKVKVPTFAEIKLSLLALGLSTAHVATPQGEPTAMGESLVAYFGYRAQILNDFVEPRLMDAQRAESTFTELKKQLCPTGARRALWLEGIRQRSG